MRARTKVWALAVAGALMLAVAQPGRAADDIPGSKDHPMLSRFAGAQINAYSVQDYDEALMPNQKIDRDDKVQALSLEGKVTRIGYRIGGGKSPLEVYRNYQAALKDGGFETIFACKNDEQCGEDFQRYVINSDKVRRAGQGDAAFGGTYYGLLAKKAAPAGDVYVFLDIMEDDSNHITPVYQQVVETKAMQQGQVKVLDATAMQKALDESGKVAIYGVYFDTDKAEIKSDSKESLDQMGKLLKDNPSLKVYVVGHTDNEGALAHNRTLSQQRADAVVKALVSQYGVDAKRLEAYGVASLAPVASNDSDQGRAKNRRVELVKE
ncbi:OmpA family protein [Bordetella sp. N]|uniref:OmpA family protein n=1 Tax=Bordetella sp. N TaxID=1746199 RepID=UPI00070B462C|nr:OmpA family protein [Bordetella sp. N]ALM84383.1 cell envelope biogenesis protein OmpA [Bordetella sp. N]